VQLATVKKGQSRLLAVPGPGWPDGFGIPVPEGSQHAPHDDATRY